MAEVTSLMMPIAIAIDGFRQDVRQALVECFHEGVIGMGGIQTWLQNDAKTDPVDPRSTFYIVLTYSN